MQLNLNGKLAVVTGSTQGIGRAIAEALAEEGARVVINGRGRERAERVAAEIPGEARAVAADLTTAAGVEALFEGAREIAPVDILVNNFGIFEPKPFEDIPDERWEDFFRANVLSGIRASRMAIPSMRERGWGRIIFISSESGVNIPVEMPHYGMTKTAQLSVSRVLAKHLRGTGVTVNSVLPGPTWTEGVKGFVEELAGQRGESLESAKEDFIAENRPDSLIERWADPEEVAALVAFLCGESAAAITGTAQRVEGGIVNICF